MTNSNFRRLAKVALISSLALTATTAIAGTPDNPEPLRQGEAIETEAHNLDHP